MKNFDTSALDKIMRQNAEDLKNGKAFNPLVAAFFGYSMVLDGIYISYDGYGNVIKQENWGKP